MSRVSKFFSMASKEASKASNDDYRHGAVLVKGGKVICLSHNTPIPSRFADRYKHHSGIATRHAEVNCILGLDRKVTDGSVVFVVRISRSGSLRLSKPCDMCLSILKYVGVKRVYYSIWDNEYGVMKIQDI